MFIKPFLVIFSLLVLSCREEKGHPVTPVILPLTHKQVKRPCIVKAFEMEHAVARARGSDHEYNLQIISDGDTLCQVKNSIMDSALLIMARNGFKPNESSMTITYRGDTTIIQVGTLIPNTVGEVLILEFDKNGNSLPIIMLI